MYTSCFDVIDCQNNRYLTYLHGFDIEQIIDNDDNIELNIRRIHKVILLEYCAPQSLLLISIPMRIDKYTQLYYFTQKYPICGTHTFSELLEEFLADVIDNNENR